MLQRTLHVWQSSLIVLVLLALLFINFQPLNAAPKNLREHEIKAVYLFRFGKFVTFPQQVFATDKTPFNICLLGDNLSLFGKALEHATRKEHVDNHKVQVRYLDNTQAATGCQIIYISLSEQHNISAIMRTIANQPILTVSDMPNFIRYGGMIEFFNRRNRIHFMIAPKTVKVTGLKMSARLLQIAKIID